MDKHNIQIIQNIKISLCFEDNILDAMNFSGGSVNLHFEIEQK